MSRVYGVRERSLYDAGPTDPAFARYPHILPWWTPPSSGGGGQGRRHPRTWQRAREVLGDLAVCAAAACCIYKGVYCDNR